MRASISFRILSKSTVGDPYVSKSSPRNYDKGTILHFTNIKMENKPVCPTSDFGNLEDSMELAAVMIG